MSVKLQMSDHKCFHHFIPGTWSMILLLPAAHSNTTQSLEKETSHHKSCKLYICVYIIYIYICILYYIYFNVIQDADRSENFAIQVTQSQAEGRGLNIKHDETVLFLENLPVTKIACLTSHIPKSASTICISIVYSCITDFSFHVRTVFFLHVCKSPQRSHTNFPHFSITSNCPTPRYDEAAAAGADSLNSAWPVNPDEFQTVGLFSWRVPGIP